MAAGKQRKVQTENKVGGLLSDFIDIVKAYLMLLRLLRPKVRIKRLEMNLVMASDDPCDLAVNYGRAWAAVGNLMPRLENKFVIKRRDVEVECDFEADQTRVIARLDLTITLGRIIGTTLFHGGRAGLEFMKIIKKRKGGVSK